MIGSLVSRLVILTFGALYPAYASFKVVQSKDQSNYVRWMIYFIVFAIFTCIEIFTDLFLRWFPFYYEMKVLFVLWLVSPMFNGSSILYRQFLHPLLKSKEPEIDRIKEEGYATLRLFSKKVIFRARDIFVDMAHQLHSNLLHPITCSNESHSVEENKEVASDSKNVPHEGGGDKGFKNLIKNRGCRCRAPGWKIME